jgi:thiol-disulfide isomerase/thioredoxin
MRKPLQFILLSFLFISLDATTNMPNKSSDVGDISIKGLFESNQEFQENYSEYNSNSLLDFSLFRDVEIFVLFGTWCHDSKREVPRFLKLLSDSKVSENQINLIGLNFMKNDFQDRGKKFKIKKTPTFVILRNQVEIGRIVERPEISLEADLLKILETIN